MIKHLTIQDIDAMASIHKQNFYRPWKNGDFLTMFQAPTISAFGVFTSELASELASFIILQIVDDEAEILTIVTNVEHTRCGYASQLLLYSIAVLRQKNVKTFCLEVRVSNKIAIDLYRKFDFKKLSQRTDYYKTPCGRKDALVLSLNLYN